MERVLIKDIFNHTEKNIKIKGWVKKVRDLKSVTFLIINDKSGEIQVVLDKKEEFNTLVHENDVVEVTGKVKKTNQQLNGLEIISSKIIIINHSKNFPIEINKDQNINLNTILDNRFCSHRDSNIQEIFKITNTVVESVQNFLRSEGFIQIFTPKIVEKGAEGGSNIFEINYFKNKAYLCQSPQFYKQMMSTAGYEKVFEIAPVFRAEKHNTSRHLNEYTSIDVEMSFIDSFEEIMKLQCKMMKYIIENVNKKHSEYLQKNNIILNNFDVIPIMTLKEVQNILWNEFHKKSPEGDLDSEGEQLISEYVLENFSSQFVFITHYPISNRPMYTMKNKNNEKLSDSYDLIFKGTEITSGGQRIHEYEMLKKNIIAKGLNVKEFNTYLEIFEYGVPPHGGFAIGLERFIAKLLNLKNIKEASAFPRDMNRLLP